MRILSLIAAALCFSVGARAIDIPPPSGYVNDRAGLLSKSAVLKLEHFLEGFEKSDSTQIVVLTLPALEGEPVEEVALKVAEKWKIGQKGKDNGALLLISRDDQKIRIEVGYGLEGRLTDLLTGRIVDNDITPRFREGDYDGGVIAGVAAMAEAVRGEYTGTGKRKKERNPLGFLGLLLFLGPFLAVMGGRGRSGRSRYYRHGGFWIGGGGGSFGGGGFGGFSGGGGGFGGGGASGGW